MHRCRDRTHHPVARKKQTILTRDNRRCAVSINAYARRIGVSLGSKNRLARIDPTRKRKPSAISTVPARVAVDSDRSRPRRKARPEPSMAQPSRPCPCQASMPPKASRRRPSVAWRGPPWADRWWAGQRWVPRARASPPRERAQNLYRPPRARTPPTEARSPESSSAVEPAHQEPSFYAVRPRSLQERWQRALRHDDGSASSPKPGPRRPGTSISGDHRDGRPNAGRAPSTCLVAAHTAPRRKQARRPLWGRS